ncbi:hypothetical protein [uncultured Algibacter sp.]|uniref:hypothetical protein n=1 Tax=uncultured Algibacter sp. TaxID=298659 RepID=UPI0025F6266F|nr:hypothetical protein [uncultured Algibacter sp.]
MIEMIFTIIFVIIVFVIGILTKRILYINEHVQSIENGLYIFNDNFETIKSIDKTSDFDLGSGHLYG